MTTNTKPMLTAGSSTEASPIWVSKGLRLHGPHGHRRFIDPFSGIRYYPVPAPDGDGMIAVPGVTSVLSALADPEEKQRLEEWRQKEVAEGRDPNARRRCGSRVHALLETRIRTGDIAGSSYQPDDPDDLWVPPNPEALKAELRSAAGGANPAAPVAGLAGSALAAFAEQHGVSRLLRRGWDGDALELQEHESLRDFLDLCFYSGMEQHLEAYEAFLWSERPLRDGWEHCWSAPPGEPGRLARVWSTTWGFSGTPDLIARRPRGVNILGDFKTSTRPYYRCHGSRVPAHKETGFKKYKKCVRQLCAYRLAIKETLDLDIHALQIIVGLPQPGMAQMFYVQGTELEIETENVKQAAVRFWSQFSGCTVPDPSARQAIH